MSFDWHRAFGLLFKDKFSGTPFDVEINEDISIKEQRLDVIVVRRRPGVMSETLPDGFEPLAAHNLITFKSFRGTLDDWTLDELLSYYVGYRKAASIEKELPPEADFRLYAVATRRPEGLMKKYELKTVGPGVYDYHWGSRPIRLLVVKELPWTEPNAGLALFSADREQVSFGQTHFRQKDPEMSSFLGRLMTAYRSEGVDVPYGYKEFIEETKQEIAQEYTAEDMARLFSVERRLEGIPVERRLEGIPPEQLLEKIPPELIERYLKSLSPSGSGEQPK